MNLKTVLSLLDIFRLKKGQKIVEEPAAPLAPLLQRLTLPVMLDADSLCRAEKAAFVAEVIQQNIAEGRLPNKKMIAKRTVHKISHYYGLKNLKGFGFFRAIPEKPSMIEFKKATVTRLVGA